MLTLPNGETRALPLLMRIAGLVDALPEIEQPAETVMFVTSTHYGQIMAELKEACTDPWPTGKEPSRLIIGGLTVVNSGTEDQRAVNEANRQHAEQCQFAYKRDNLITGRA